MFSGLFLRKVRISSVARENRDGATSWARIDAERSSMITRSSRSNCGIRVVNWACGRASANTSAPPAMSVRLVMPASRAQVERRERGRKRSVTGVSRR